MAAEEQPVQDAHQLDEVPSGPRRRHHRRPAVRAVGAHLHRLHVDRLQEEGGKDLAEGVEAHAATGVAHLAAPGAHQVDVDQPAPVDAEGARVGGALDDDAHLIVVEAEVTDLAERPRTTDEIGAVLDEARPRLHGRLHRAARGRERREEGDGEDEGGRRRTAKPGAHQNFSWVTICRRSLLTCRAVFSRVKV